MTACCARIVGIAFLCDRWVSRFTMVVENFAVYVRAVPTLRTRSETTYDFGLKNLLASFIAFRAEPYSLPTASRISENACTVRGEM